MEGVRQSKATLTAVQRTLTTQTGRQTNKRDTTNKRIFLLQKRGNRQEAGIHSMKINVSIIRVTCAPTAYLVVKENQVLVQKQAASDVLQPGWQLRHNTSPCRRGVKKTTEGQGEETV